MVDIDTGLSTLYMMSGDFCNWHVPSEPLHPGPQASLSHSEVITLALFGQWVQFKSERAFYRYAELHLRAAFPTLPDRRQFNRLMREQRDTITAFSLYLVRLAMALFRVLGYAARIPVNTNFKQWNLYNYPGDQIYFRKMVLLAPSVVREDLE
jgi:hypothetical protein